MIRIKNLLLSPNFWGLIGLLLILMFGCTTPTSTIGPEGQEVVITSPDPEQVTRDVEAIIRGINRAQSQPMARQQVAPQ